MLEEQYKRAFNSIVPSPQLVGRTERSVEDMINSKKVRKITLRAALAVALILAVLTAVGYAAVHSLLLEGRSPEIVQQLEPLMQPVESGYQGEYVDIQVTEALLTQDSLSLAWTVTNKTDQLLYIDYPVCFKLNGGYSSGAKNGSWDFEYYLEPGQQVQSQQNTAILPSDPAAILEYDEDDIPYDPPLQDVNNRCEIGLSVYLVPENLEDIPEYPDDACLAPSGTDFGATYPASEGRWALVEAAHVEFFLDLESLHTLSAPAQSFDRGSHTLQIDQARVTATGADFSWKIIYDTYEEATAWPTIRYELEPADGLGEWALQYDGINGSPPVELPDGRWAWEIQRSFTDLVRIPTSFVLVPVVDGQMLAPEEGVIIELS